MQEQRVQAATGVALSAFVFTHIANHALMHFGPELHQQLFSKIRSLFRAAPVLEYTLLASLGVHALLGVKNFSGFDFGTTYFIHQASGWYLLLGLPPHIFFARVEGPTVVPDEKEYDVTMVSMASRVFPYFFLPYYTLLTGFGLVHAYTGIARAGRILDWNWAIKHLPISGPQYMNIVYVLGVLGVSTTFAVTGVYYRFPIKHQNAIIKSVKDGFPKFLMDRMDLSNNVWFARFRWAPVASAAASGEEAD